jgi:hypothetical protein
MAVELRVDLISSVARSAMNAVPRPAVKRDAYALTMLEHAATESWRLTSS